MRCGVCLHLQLKERISGAPLTDQMPEIAAVIAEKIELRRRPEHVLPAVII
jgi:hypothetical protein